MALPYDDRSSSAARSPNLTFAQRLMQKKQQLGGWALASCCLMLSLHLMDQKKELRKLRGESSTIRSLREENLKLKETLAAVSEVLSGEETAEGRERSLELLLDENSGASLGAENLALKVKSEDLEQPCSDDLS